MSLEIPKYNEIRTSLHQYTQHILWRQDIPSLPLWKRFLIRSAQIIYAISRDWHDGQLSLRAMSLVYSTILGFIPTLALIFAVLKSLGVHNAMEPALMTLLEALGERRDDITQQIIGFVDNIQVEIIGITSIGILIYLVLDMMRKIESSFNYIWSVSQGRSWSSRVSEYLFAVIVSPLLIFISISITTTINTVFFADILDNLAFGSTLISFFGFLFPLLFMSLAFAFAYSFLPNTKVNFSSAFIGGMVTTIIWKIMGAFFQAFLITSARESIYLAFATVIAIMIFVYIGWLVVLLGSDIAYYHQHPNKAKTGRKPLAISIGQQEELTLTLAGIIFKRFQDKIPPLSEEHLAHRLGLSPMAIDKSLQFLQSSGLVVATNDDPPRFLPQSSVSDCTMSEIWQALRNSDAGLLHINPQLEEYRQARDFLGQVNKVVTTELGSKKFMDNTSEDSS